MLKGCALLRVKNINKLLINNLKFITLKSLKVWIIGIVYIAVSLFNTGIAFGESNCGQVAYVERIRNTNNISRYLKKNEDNDKGKVIPVLMYHDLSNNLSDPDSVTPEKFKDDMLALKNAGYETIFLSDIIQYLNNFQVLPEKPIVITFDDGYYSNYKYTYPIAKETGIKFTISIIGWSVGRTTFIDSEKPITPHFSWKQAKEMLDSGIVDIQNHTFDLHSPQGISYGYNEQVGRGVLQIQGEEIKDYENRLKEDLLRLNIETYLNTGHMPTFVTYPYGQYNNETEKIICKLGFIGTITTTKGVRRFKSLNDLKEIPRLNVPMQLRGEKLIQVIENLKEI